MRVSIWLHLLLWVVLVAAEIVQRLSHSGNRDQESSPTPGVLLYPHEWLGWNIYTPFVKQLLANNNLFTDPNRRSVRACWGAGQILEEGTCEFVVLDDLAEARSEEHVLEIAKKFCILIMDPANDSPDAKMFFGGFGGLVDCIVMLHRTLIINVISSVLTTKQAVKLLRPVYRFAPQTVEYSALYQPPTATAERKVASVEGAVDDATPTATPACIRPNWMWELQDYEDKYLSQGPQDGVLRAIFEQIKSTNRFFVEIGFNTPTWEVGSNTFFLHLVGQWKGLLLDAEFDNPDINLHKHFVTATNVLKLFELYGVPDNPDYVSVDIDSQDLWVAQAILNSPRFRPRVLSIEYNAHLPLGSTAVMPPGDGWNGFDAYYGTSAGAVRLMAQEAGYEVVHFASVLDIFLVHRSLLGDLCPPPFASFARRVSFLHTCVTDPERKGRWVEYSTYMRSGGKDVEAARFAALEQILLMTKPGDSGAGSAECLGFA